MSYVRSKEKHNTYMKAYYRNNPDKKSEHDEWVKRRSHERKDMLIKLKGGKCMDCGFAGHPAALDFDHRNPFEKYLPIARLLNGAKMAKLMEEVEKCDLVCANCHRIRTWVTGRFAKRTMEKE